MSLLEPKYYFPEMLIPDVKGNIKKSYEKLKLNFSVLNANKGVYSFQIKFYDEQVIDFNSEIKKIDQKQKIIFEKFFVCNYYYEDEQIVQITINQNNNKKIINLNLNKILLSPDFILAYQIGIDEYFLIKAEKLNKTEDLLNIRISLKNDPKFFENNKFYYLLTSKNSDIYKSAEITKNGVFVDSLIPICLLESIYTISLYSLEGKLLYKYNRAINSVKNKEIYQTKFSILNDKCINLFDYSEVIEKFKF